jgi:5-formyltetrahydrofolate cyclo-ligase
MKKDLRKKLLEKRDKLASKDIKSIEIAEKFINMDIYKKAKAIMIYASFKSEVMTDYLLKCLTLDNKTIIFPKCSIKANEILPIKIENESDFEIGAYGILEPIGEIYKKDEIDIVVVPAISFDKKGHRLGYGKGYYDRFLKDFKGQSVGFCYSDMIEEGLPIEDHDIKVDMVICESGVSN